MYKTLRTAKQFIEVGFQVTVFGDSIDDTSFTLYYRHHDLIDLVTFQFKDLHLDGTNIDELSITDGFTYNGVTLNTSGSGAASSLSVTGSQFDFKANNPDNLFTLYNTSDESISTNR